MATFANVKVDAAPADIFSAPAEVKVRVPEVTVDNVNPFDVVEIVDEPKPVIDKAPDVDVIFKAPAERVNPFVAVDKPFEVIVPPPVVEIFPDVVTASPALLGDNVVPVLLQYPSTPDVGGVDVSALEPLVYTPDEAVSPESVNPVNVGEAAEEIP